MSLLAFLGANLQEEHVGRGSLVVRACSWACRFNLLQGGVILLAAPKLQSFFMPWLTNVQTHSKGYWLSLLG